MTTFQTQAPVAVPSAASFPDGAAAAAAKTTAMDDLLGLESEISAIQVVLELLINEKVQTMNFLHCIKYSVYITNLLNIIPVKLLLISYLLIIK